MNPPSYEISLSPPVRLRLAFKNLDRAHRLNLFMTEFVQDLGDQIKYIYSNAKNNALSCKQLKIKYMFYINKSDIWR